MITAEVRVDNLMKLQTDEEYVEGYVNSNLASLLTQEIMKTMTVTSRNDIATDSTVYTATLPITHTTANSITVGTSAGYNGTFTNNHVSGIITKQPELRVMEFTKNGKVTRVELQYYDGDNWIKVPRHTFEE